MTTVHVQVTLSLQELLKATEQLDNAELKSFMQQLSALYVQRQVPHLSQKEGELLQQINQGIPETLWQPYKKLVARRDANELTPEEHQELVALSDQIEILHIQRMGYLVELAQLRQVTLPELMDALGITPKQKRPSLTEQIGQMDLPIADWEQMEQEIEKGRLAS